jgi:hypothetical protein
MDIIELMQDEKKARKAKQYARAINQLRDFATNLTVRSPLDRSKSKAQEDLLSETDFDIKANTFIVISGVDKDVATTVQYHVQRALLEILTKIQDTGSRAVLDMGEEDQVSESSDEA